MIRHPLEPIELKDKEEKFLILKEESEQVCPTCSLTMKCTSCRLYIDPDEEFIGSLTPTELKEEYGCRKFDDERC